MTELKCPRCRSTNVMRERRLNGNDICMACDTTWPSTDLPSIDFRSHLRMTYRRGEPSFHEFVIIFDPICTSGTTRAEVIDRAKTETQDLIEYLQKINWSEL